MTPDASTPRLRVVDAHATPEEIAAIVAALGAITAEGGAADDTPEGTLHEWVHSARLAARRSGLQRGPWRLSGRIGRRARA